MFPGAPIRETVFIWVSLRLIKLMNLTKML
jgi:hypothetical protein